MSRPYIIGTGYHSSPDRRAMLEWFWHLWLDNTRRYSNPREVVILASGNIYPDWVPDEPETNWIYLSGNLGHCGSLLSGEKPYRFCGCLAGMMTLALYAYCSEADFIYKEQDTLAFGPWVEQMYAEIGRHGCIFGSCGNVMPSSQALLLVKHGFIPDFVRLYLGTGSENTPDNMPECKFARLEKEHPNLFCRYSFGYDRARPFNVNDKVWHAQKFTCEELELLAAAKLIPAEAVKNMPQTEGAFTNG